MKKPHFLIMIIFTLVSSVYGQTGIGTHLPNNSSELEIYSNNKGVLIPRIELKNSTDKLTIVGTDYPDSLIVYHTGTKDMLAGFYFWSGDKWNTLVSNTTLNHYIKEIADPNSVKIIEDKGDYIFTWINKDTNEEETMKLSEVIRKFETLTTLTPEEITMYVYLEQNPVIGEMMEVHVDKEKEIDPNAPVVPSLLRTYKAKKFVYKNEQEDLVDIKGSDLFGGIGSDGSPSGIETVTSLKLEDDYNSKGKALVYSDENKDITTIYVADIFTNSETLTSLKADINTKQLIYTDELKSPTFISFNQIAQEPWYVVNTTEQATKNNQDIYINGWVGIGYSEKSDSAKVPNEKLRINGSITATNSYYADYVFDNYFEGYSNLKYDYKFYDLTSVDRFIRTNRHLPGITPIADLEKTDLGYSFNVSELSIQLLEKTEELFLHVIDQQKELNKKGYRIEKLETEMNEMAKRLQALEALLVK